MKDPLLGNKIAGAVLAALLLFFGLPLLADALFGTGHEGGHEAKGEAQANPFPQYPVAYAQEESAGAEEAAPEGPDLGALLAEAKPEAGERRAAICKACHTLEKDGANKTGPNLWGVVGRPVASEEGFKYSAALKSFGGEWTYEKLDEFLKDSGAAVPGTAMAQRITKPEQRAELLAFLRTLADQPAPLPEPAASPEEAQGEGESSREKEGEEEDAKPSGAADAPKDSSPEAAAGDDEDPDGDE